MCMHTQNAKKEDEEEQCLSYGNNSVQKFETRVNVPSEVNKNK